MKDKLIAELKNLFDQCEKREDRVLWDDVAEILSRHEAEQGSTDAVIKGLQKAVEEAEKMVEYNAELVKERDAKIAVLSKIEAEQGEGLRGAIQEIVDDHLRVHNVSFSRVKDNVVIPLRKLERLLATPDKPTEPWEFIKSLCKRAFETSKSKGWKHDNDGQSIALMHSELSEALEAMRKPDKKDEHLPHLNPVGLELADTIIRAFDYCGARGIDLATCIKEKMDYNDKRPMKHGGKVF